MNIAKNTTQLNSTLVDIVEEKRRLIEEDEEGGEKIVNNVSRREGRPLIVGLGNLRGIFKKTGQRTKLRRR